MVEHRTVAPDVAGSIPVSHPNSRYAASLHDNSWPARGISGNLDHDIYTEPGSL
jgi:hypothetical protein